MKSQRRFWTTVLLLVALGFSGCLEKAVQEQGSTSSQLAGNIISNQERANVPVYNTSGLWTYRALDKLYDGYTTKVVNGDFEFSSQDGKSKIFHVNGGDKVEANYVGDLPFMIPSTGTLQDEAQFFQFPLMVGKKWKANYYDKDFSRWFVAENSVTDIETVTTPAGTFPAFRIERRVFYMSVGCDLCDHNKYWLTYTYFYSPQTRSILKYHYQQEQEMDGMGDPLLQHTIDIELIKFDAAIVEERIGDDAHS